MLSGYGHQVSDGNGVDFDEAYDGMRRRRRTEADVDQRVSRIDRGRDSVGATGMIAMMFSRLWLRLRAEGYRLALTKLSAAG